MQVIGERPNLHFKTVVYATDFSVFSQNAGLYASLLAKHFSARLMVAHAFTLSQAAMEVEIDRSLLSQQRKDLEFLLSRKASMLSRESVEVVPVLLDGDPSKALPDLADKNAPSLIVLGTHGGGWVEREIIGSVADGILRSTSWPSLTVGSQVQSAASKVFPFQRILYATDLTPAAAHTAVFAVSVAEAFRADIDVLNVVEKEALDRGDRFDDLMYRFYSALNTVVPRRATEFCNAKTFIEVGKAHDQILRHIRERSIDLLVLGIQRSSHLSIEMRMSRAFQLVVHAACPVLTLVA